MNPTGPEVVILGYAAQHLRAFKQISNQVVDSVLFALAFGLYALNTPLLFPVTAQSVEAWAVAGFVYAMASHGAGSVAGHLNAAPATNSK